MVWLTVIKNNQVFKTSIVKKSLKKVIKKNSSGC